MLFISKVFKRYSIKDIFLFCIKYLIGIPLHMFSYVCPRNKKKWVFGHQNGFVDNSKYLYIYLINNTNEKVIWVAHSRTLYKEMRQKGLPVCYKYCFIGLYHLLTAYYYVKTSSPRNVCYWTSGGAFKVDLWHGVGIKAIGESSASLGASSFLSKIIIPRDQPNVFLSTSEFMTDHFTKSKKIERQNIYEGIYPRCKFLLENEAFQLSFISKYESKYSKEFIEKLRCFDRVFIYMPTWRLMYEEKLIDVALPDFEKLNEELLKINGLFIIKPHAAMRTIIKKAGNYSNIISIIPETDIYPILPFTDVLITDYSSIYYDYLLMDGKGCILYDFDYDQYVKKEYKFICDYKEYTPGPHVRSFEELLQILSTNKPFDIKRREWILEKFWGNYEAKDLRSLYEAIVNKKK